MHAWLVCKRVIRDNIRKAFISNAIVQLWNYIIFELVGILWTIEQASNNAFGIAIILGLTECSEVDKIIFANFTASTSLILFYHNHSHGSHLIAQ